jgi:hypothetical protein
VPNQAKNQNVRLRFSIKNTAAAAASNYAYRLQVAQKTQATCEAQSTGWSDVPTTTGGCGSSVACMTTSSYFVAGDSTSNLLTAPASSTFSRGQMVEDSWQQTGALTLFQNYYTEVEYNFQFTNNAVNGSDYCLRVTNAGTTIDSYTKVAQIRVGPYVDETHYRWRNDTAGESATWYNASWLYRKKIPITGSSGAGNNYQVKIRVGESAGSSNYDVHLEGHVRADFGDVRFADNDGTTLLNYWQETVSGSTPTQTATYWVKVNDNLSGDRYIYVYYGNSSATSQSSGPNTFLFYDDFEDGTLNKWTALNGTWSITTATGHGYVAQHSLPKQATPAKN